MDDIVDLEATFFQQGLQEGIAHGEALGLENGKRHGREEGHEIGFELGFARGMAEACLAKYKNDSAIINAANALLDAVDRVNLDQVPNGGAMQRVRARFKVLESRANLQLSATNNRRDFTF